MRHANSGSTTFLLAQRSGLPPYANGFMFGLGFGPEAAMHSLRYVPPASSFRAVQALGVPDWPAAATREILEPLGMHSTTFTAAGIESASDHAAGNGWTPQGSFEIPYTADFYGVGPAGDVNSNVVGLRRLAAAYARQRAF